MLQERSRPVALYYNLSSKIKTISFIEKEISILDVPSFSYKNKQRNLALPPSAYDIFFKYFVEQKANILYVKF